jgi:hypothetical protein
MLAFSAASIACLRLQRSLCLSVPKPTTKPSTLLPAVPHNRAANMPQHSMPYCGPNHCSPRTPVCPKPTYATTPSATLWRYSFPKLPYVAPVLWRGQLCPASTVCMHSIGGVWQIQTNPRTQNGAGTPKLRARSQCKAHNCAQSPPNTAAETLFGGLRCLPFWQCASEKQVHVGCCRQNTTKCVPGPETTQHAANETWLYSPHHGAHTTSHCTK